MARKTEKSDAAFNRGRNVLVGGVNSPVRAFTAVGSNPPVIAKAKGASITDIDGNTYIDFVGGYGPAILGHAAEETVTAITKAVRHGTCFGGPTQAETQLAEAIVAAIESAQRVRFVNSGTEAVMTALRLARGATSRQKIIKCIGCYHGHCDAMLVAAGSGAMTLGVPSSPGVPPGATADTILVGYNDLSAVRKIFESCGSEIAAMLLEPVCGNMGVVSPAEGYLAGLRQLCDDNGALLIFDEVMTGFRVAYGGAQQLFGVKPDLTILGKIIGGGMPVGAVAGPGQIMDNLAPQGSVYQAGTLSGSPAAMAAGIATLNALRDGEVYETIEQHASQLEQGLHEAADQAGLAGRVCINRVAGMLCCFFTPGPVTDHASASASDTGAFAAYFNAMLDAGVYLPPSQFETMFVSCAHSDIDIADTVKAARTAFAAADNVM